jgi:WD40 repeat protein
MAETQTKPTEPKISRLKEFKVPGAALALAASADGSALFVACMDGAVVRIDVESGAVKELGRHESYASGAVLLPDARTLVSSGYDGVLLWHDLEAGKVTHRVKAHEFWSWDLAASRDGRFVASSTGQYLAGGYKYEPAAEREPSVRLYDAKTGTLLHSLTHIPPVQAVAFSPDGNHVAAGNLMGEVRVWETASGREVSQWKSDDLTSWGIIKSHHYLGGVFSMEFNPAGDELYVCGMGPMRDPMAGNGSQRWMRFEWKTGKKLDQTHDGESGAGLMEAVTFRPDGKHFLMAGRLVQGTWNLALFETATGKNVFSTDAKLRITDALFSGDGSRLFLAKARHQEIKDGKWLDAGVVEIHTVEV